MTTMGKAVGRGRQKKNQEPLECSTGPLKKKRGRKRRSPSPPPPPGPVSFFKIMVQDFKNFLYIPPLLTLDWKGLDKKYVYIEDVVGKYWNVRISMVNGSLAFQKGWSHFLSAHSIVFGELVIFTYTGGLLFTARIFESSGLERLNFQIKKRSVKCAKEMCTTELKPDIVLPSKRMKASHASEDKQNPSINELLHKLKRGKEGFQFGFPDIEIVESDSISERILEVPSASVKLPHCDSNFKEPENVIGHSEETSHRNMDATVEEVEELNLISPTEPGKSNAVKVEAVAFKSFSSSHINMDATLEKVNTVEEKDIMSLTKPEKSVEENLETVANKSIKNMITTEKVGSLFHSRKALISKLEKKLDTMTITDICTFLVHSDIKEGLPEMNSSYKMGINGKMEESNSHDLDMIDSEPHNDNLAAQSNLQQAESNQMEFNMVEPNVIDDIILLSADGICYTFDEKFAAPAIGTSFDVNRQVQPICQNEHATCGPETSAPCETISVVSSNPILICSSKTKKENLMQTSEEYEDNQIKGSSIIAESDFQPKPSSQLKLSGSGTMSDSRPKSVPVLPWMRNPVNLEQSDECPLGLVPRLDPRLVEALQKMGITSLFSVQLAMWQETIGPGAFERDICVNSPTGSGKTLAYALPIVQILSTRKIKCLRALVVLPTRDLALQVKEVFDAIASAVGLSVGIAVGQSSIADEVTKLIEQPRLDMALAFDPEDWKQTKLQSSVDILVATPGRLMDHINMTKGFSLEHLCYLVVDETDRLLREAYQSWLPAVIQFACSKSQALFKEAVIVPSMLNALTTIRRVGVERGFKDRSYPRLVKMIMSATLTQDPSKLSQLDLHHPLLLTSGKRRYKLPEKLEAYKLICESKLKPLYLVALLQYLRGEKSIVFTSSVESTRRLCKLLNLFDELPCKIREYSSLQHQTVRSKRLKAFREGKIEVLIASDAMTRGMDVEGVKNVINYDMPTYVKAFVHRAGRTARAGHKGRCFTLLRKDEVKPFRKILTKADNMVCNVHTLPANSVESLRPFYSSALEKLKEYVNSKKGNKFGVRFKSAAVVEKNSEN